MKKILLLLFLFLLLVGTAGQLYASEITGTDSVAVLSETVSDTSEHPLPPVFMVIPFVVLLLLIATMPLLAHQIGRAHV